MNLLGIGSLIKGIAEGADELITSDEERLKAGIESKRIDAGLVQGQLKINAAEAGHKSVFVAGWRPAIGWVGVFALAYQFILYPLLTWSWVVLKAYGYVPDELDAPPVLSADVLWVIISGMLGIAGMRSYDKVKRTSTEKVG